MIRSKCRCSATPLVLVAIVSRSTSNPAESTFGKQISCHRSWLVMWYPCWTKTFGPLSRHSGRHAIGRFVCLWLFGFCFDSYVDCADDGSDAYGGAILFHVDWISMWAFVVLSQSCCCCCHRNHFRFRSHGDPPSCEPFRRSWGRHWASTPRYPSVALRDLQFQSRVRWFHLHRLSSVVFFDF